MRHYVPGYVFQQGAFTPIFKSIGICSPGMQEQMLHQILHPASFVCCVGDTFGDPKTGRYFAVWLASIFNRRSRSATPLYVSCDHQEPDEFTGVVYAPELKRIDAPCVTIISLGFTITDVQAERARDIIAKFDVPVIIQCSSHDPISIAQRLHKPCNFAFYLTGAKAITV